MKLLIGWMAMKTVEDLEDDYGLGQSKEREKKIEKKKDSGKSGKKREQEGITEA